MVGKNTCIPLSLFAAQNFVLYVYFYLMHKILTLAKVRSPTRFCLLGELVSLALKMFINSMQAQKGLSLLVDMISIAELEELHVWRN